MSSATDQQTENQSSAPPTLAEVYAEAPSNPDLLPEPQQYDYWHFTFSPPADYVEGQPHFNTPPIDDTDDARNLLHELRNNVKNGEPPLLPPAIAVRIAWLMNPDRSPAEHAFAEAMTHQYKDAILEIDSNDPTPTPVEGPRRGAKYYIEHALGERYGGADATLAFSLGQYVYENLKERGVSEPEAIKKILEWTQDGRSSFTGDGYTPHLKGTEADGAHEAITKPFTLPLDKTGQSVAHRFAEQRAKFIVTKHLLAPQVRSAA